MPPERRSQILEEPFAVTPERMFEVLTTPAAIRSWWGATTVVIDPRTGGTLVTGAGEGDKGAEFVNSFVILEFERPRRILLGRGKYIAENNWPIETNMTTEFIIDPQPSGCTLRIVQELDPADPLLDDYFDACIFGWQNCFEGIRNYIHNNPA